MLTKLAWLAITNVTNVVDVDGVLDTRTLDTSAGCPHWVWRLRLSESIN